MRMDKKKICFIAQFPPPIHGLSKAVETLYNSKLQEEFDFEKIDITSNCNFLKNLYLINQSKADLFYFTISQTKGGNLRDLVILKLLHVRHKKCLIHLHGGYYRKLIDNDLFKWQRKENYKAIGHLAGAFVLGKSFQSIFAGMLPQNKVFIVPNCVDDEYLMSNEEFKEKIEKLQKRKVKHILYMSNFIHTKGYPEVLEMAKLEKERFDRGEEKKFHFDFAGHFFEKSEKQYFFDYVEKNNLEGFVTYHGVVDGDKKRKLLKENYIFVLLTRYSKEGQPISILEAMGNGMFIVTTDHAGIPDVVEDEVNGIVISQDVTTEVIYQRLLDYANKQLCEVINKNREYCIAQFSQRNYLNNLNKCFKEEMR